jgi:CHASE2 domain-containing sensor protein
MASAVDGHLDDSQRPHPKLGTGHRRWQFFWRRLRHGLVLALLLEGVLHLAHGLVPIETLDDLAMDWTMGLFRNANPVGHDPVAFTYLDIDDTTFEKWGEPLFTPRDRVAQLLKRVVRARPALIVVDIEFGPPSGTQGDNILLNFLDDYERGRGAYAADRRPPLLLAYPFPMTSPWRTGAGQRAIEKRHSFLEAAVTNRKLSWVSTAFSREPDGVIRRWRLWERISIRQRDGRLCDDIIPSCPLVAAGLLLAPKEGLEGINRLIRRAATSTFDNACTGQEVTSPAGARASLDGAGRIVQGDRSATAPLRLGNLTISVPPSRLNQRIFYRFPGELRRGEYYPVHPITGRELLTILPAYPITEVGNVSLELLAGRVVVIGGSFASGRDFHATPIGPLPGGLILANAIDSLLENGELKEIEWRSRYLFVALLVVAMSLIFTLLPRGRRALIASLVVISCVLPLSIRLFGDGYWLDFSIPLLGVLLHELATRFETTTKAIPKSDPKREAYSP